MTLPDNQTWSVTEMWHQQRLDHFLAEQCADLSRNHLQKLIEAGHVTVAGQLATKGGHKLKRGQMITLLIPPPQPLALEPQAIALDIVYEDSDLIVINKPADLVVHPGAGNPQGTLVNALLYHCQDLSGIGGIERPGIVHRLDKDTTGLIVVAKNDATHLSLSQQLQSRQMSRLYYAVVERYPNEDSGTITAALGRHPVHRQKMAVIPTGRFARTHWRVVERFHQFSWLELKLDTGRTHQIRVHLQYLHFPIVGDPLYGSQQPLPFRVARPLLHAHQLSLYHPRTEQQMTFQAPIPADFQRILDILR